MSPFSLTTCQDWPRACFATVRSAFRPAGRWTEVSLVARPTSPWQSEGAPALEITSPADPTPTPAVFSRHAELPCTGRCPGALCCIRRGSAGGTRRGRAECGRGPPGLRSGDGRSILPAGAPSWRSRDPRPGLLTSFAVRGVSLCRATWESARRSRLSPADGHGAVPCVRGRRLLRPSGPGVTARRHRRTRRASRRYRQRLGDRCHRLASRGTGLFTLYDLDSFITCVLQLHHELRRTRRPLICPRPSWDARGRLAIPFSHPSNIPDVGATRSARSIYRRHPAHVVARRDRAIGGFVCPPLVAAANCGREANWRRETRYPLRAGKGSRRGRCFATPARLSHLLLTLATRLRRPRVRREAWDGHALRGLPAHGEDNVIRRVLRPRPRPGPCGSGNALREA